VEYSDVQGLAKYGYRDLVEAKYFLLTVRKSDAAAAWLRSLPVSNAVYQKTAPATAVQVAFTRAGLEAMGVAAAAIQDFSTEFLQGMTEPSRCRRLGDIANSDPGSWFWGGPTKLPHLLVMIFAKQNLETLEASIQQQPWRDAF